MSRAKNEGEDNLYPDEDMNNVVPFDQGMAPEEYSQEELQQDDEQQHYQNLAFDLPDYVLSRIAADIYEAIQSDWDSAEEWRNTLTRGITELGWKIEEKEYPFKNCADVYSSAYPIACMNFLANAAKELLPPSGPIDTTIEGLSSPELEDSAYRKKIFGNYYLTEEYINYYHDTESAFFWCWLSGSGFKKVFQDPTASKARPLSISIRPEDLIVNFGATSLSDATRITHKFLLSGRELKQRMSSGFYMNVDLAHFDGSTDTQDSVADKIENVQGIEFTDYEHNKMYEIYECHTYLDLEGYEGLTEDGEDKNIELPFIVTLDTKNRKILSIYRNYDLGDFDYKRKESFVHYKFAPGLGFYGIGNAQLAAGNAKASAMIKRQCIDAGTLANFPGGLRVKGLRNDANDILVGPTEFREIDIGGMARIQDAIMMLPYKDPSPILMQLGDKLEESISQMSGVNENKIADFNQNAPVGTTYALLESSHRMQSAVIGRIHKAMAQEFKMIFEIFGEYLQDGEEYPFKVPGGEGAVMKEDFSNNVKVVPISDPNNNSSMMRLVRAESISAIAEKHPDLYNMIEVQKMLLQALNVPDIDTLLNDPQKQQQMLEEQALPLDPLTENKNAMMGRPLKVGIEQGHEAHLAVHGNQLSQLNPENPMHQPIIAALTLHNIEHEMHMCQVELEAQLQHQLPEDPTQLSMEDQNDIARIAAEHVKQQQESSQHEPPLDPAKVMEEEVQVKRENMITKAEIDKQKVDAEIYKAELDATIAREKMQMERELKERELDIKHGIATHQYDPMQKTDEIY